MHPEIPPDLRPYDLRHTFLSYILEHTGDLVVVGALAQHADARSTRRYTQRAASIRAFDAITKLGHPQGPEGKSVAPTRGPTPDPTS